MWAMAQNGKEVGGDQNGGLDLFDQISEAKMFHNEDKRASALTEREFRRHGNVQDRISFFEEEQTQKGTTVRVEVGVEVDKCDVRTFCVKMVVGSKLVAR